MVETRLLVVCGLPGSGKTTLATRLVSEREAVRLSPDEWMMSAGIDLWDEESRAAIEALQRSLAISLLISGRSVVIEWGTWARSERDTLREDARSLGVGVELHVLDEPVEVLWKRISRRRLEERFGSCAVTHDDLVEWSQAFERPTAEELKLFDVHLPPPARAIPSITALHHVQLAMPPGREDEARVFYQDLLGIPRVPKPPHLEARGGCWFERGDLRIHLGVEAVFSPAKKAHPALLVDDLDALRSHLEDAGVKVVVDQPLPGYDRFYAYDPFGNKMEFLQPLLGATAESSGDT